MGRKTRQGSWTPLDDAASFGHITLVKRTLPLVKTFNTDTKTRALHAAVRNEYGSVVNAMLEWEQSEIGKLRL
jgi:hypothetical protein